MAFHGLSRGQSERGERGLVRSLAKQPLRRTRDSLCPSASLDASIGISQASVLMHRQPLLSRTGLLAAVQTAHSSSVSFPLLPTQPCKLPVLNSTHTSVEGELLARYTASERRASYESVFKYVTGSINRGGLL